MPIMSDKWIETNALNNNLIVPFINESKSVLDDGRAVTSYGLSSFGYDLRLGNSFYLFNKYNGYRVAEDTVRGRQFSVAYEESSPKWQQYPEFIPFEEVNKGDVTLLNDAEYVTSVIDPVDFDERLVTLVNDVKTIWIPPKGFMLGVSQERIKLTREFMAICMEKSTLARCGLCVTVTPLEAGWEGYVTFEISNKTDLPIKLEVGMGICQVLFMYGNESCNVSYEDRSGKYMDQPPMPVLPKKRM